VRGTFAKVSRKLRCRRAKERKESCANMKRKSGTPQSLSLSLRISLAPAPPRGARGHATSCMYTALMLQELSNAKRDPRRESADGASSNPRGKLVLPRHTPFTTTPFGERNKWPGSRSPFTTLRNPSSISQHTCSLPHAGVHPRGQASPEFEAALLGSSPGDQREGR